MRPQAALPRPATVLAVAVLAVAILTPPALGAPATGAEPAAEVDTVASPRVSGDDQERIRAFWTRERMAAAKPAPMPEPSTRASSPPAPQQSTVFGEEWNGPQNEAPATTTGRFYYRDGKTGETGFCSASTVDTPNKNLVFTAGHCVYHPLEIRNAEKYWYTDWAYAPAYRDGATPLGVWVLGQAYVPAPYYQQDYNEEHYDLAALVALPDEEGRELVDVAGGNTIGFDVSPHEQSVHAFGYPNDPASPKPGNGFRLWHCAGTTTEEELPPLDLNTPRHSLSCSMGHGASGGPVLADYDGPGPGRGRLISVLSELDGLQRIRTGWGLFSPYFDEFAEAVFDAAKGLSLAEVYVPIGQRDGLVTGIQVQNIGTAPAIARLRWIDEAGVIVKREPVTLAAGASVTRLQQGPAGFEGSVVVLPTSFEDKLAVTVNHNDDSGAERGAVSSSTGITRGARTVHLPLLLRENSSLRTTTRVAIQNTTALPANLSLVYSHPVRGERRLDVQLPPRGSRIYNQAGAFADVPERDRPRVFAGRIESDQPLAATVLEESPASIQSYAGFSAEDGSSTLAAPLVMHNNGGGNFTGIQVQNISPDASAQVHLEYGPNTANRRPCGGKGSAPQTRVPVTVPPGASWTFIQAPEADAYFQADCTYLGSARIISTQRAVAVVNQAGASGASAYEAPEIGRLGATANLPLVQANNSNVLTGIQVQNVGSSATTVTLTLSANAAGPGTPGACALSSLSRGQSLEPGGSWTWLLWDKETFPEINDPKCRYIGSATVSGGNGSQVAVMANQLLPSDSPVRDKVSTYAGIPD